MAMHMSSKRWQDQLMVVIGVWLLVSSWVFAYPPDSAAAVNAWFSGVLISLLAAFDLVKTYVWAVLLNIAVGVWVTVSPWVVDTMRDPGMTWSLVISGIATVVLGIWELRSDPELHSQWTRSSAT